jgi:hypothetical protein
MKSKPGAFMRSISVFDVRTASLFGLLFFSPPLFANPAEGIQKAMVEAYEESSKPVFTPEEVDRNKPPETDKFFAKIRHERADFYREEKERKLKFLRKIRKNSDGPDEKRQKELAEFHQEEKERLEKFLQKQQKKIEKKHRQIRL